MMKKWAEKTTKPEILWTGQLLVTLGNRFRLYGNHNLHNKKCSFYFIVY